MEDELIRSFRRFVETAHDELGFLCTTFKHAFYLDKKPLFLTGFDLVMEAQRGRCSLCHRASFRNVVPMKLPFSSTTGRRQTRLASSVRKLLGALNLRGTQQLGLPQKYRTCSAGMVDKKLSDFSKGLGARPITLKF